MRSTLILGLRLCMVGGLLLVLSRGSVADPAAPGDAADDLTKVVATTEPDVEMPAKPSADVDRLIRQLGDDRYEVREEAQAKLAKRGLAALDALRAAQYDGDLEIASRAKYLLRLIRIDLTRKGDSAQVASALRGFQQLQPHEQMRRLEKLARLPQGEGIEALCRLVRFESSLVSAKQAAVAILEQYPSEQVPMDRLAAMLRENLRSSRRLPSLWMLSYAKFADAPEAAWREWDHWTKQEQDLAQKNDQGTNIRIVADLVTQQVQWVLRMKGPDEQLVEKIQALCDLRRRREKGLDDVIRWVVQQKAWDELRLPPLVFIQQFAGEPRWFMYQLAKHYAETGKKTLAEAAAERAFGLDSPAIQDNRRVHLLTAQRLQDEGYFAWAQREYRCVMDSGKLTDVYVPDAYTSLSAMLHDQGQNLGAAEVLQKFIHAANKDLDLARTGITMASLMAQMNYYQACHWKAAGDARKQRLSLDAGLKLDPTNVDLLIAGYNLPDADPVFRKTVRESIDKVAKGLREQVKSGTDRVTARNDLAWLLANTGGDCDEAIRLSQESLRLLRNNGAYYDTLARCYFAKGDVENAVKYQIKAVELDPHSGLIARQLGEFREAYEKKLGKPAPKPKKTKRSAREPRVLSGPSIQLQQ